MLFEQYILIKNLVKYNINNFLYNNHMQKKNIPECCTQEKHPIPNFFYYIILRHHF